MFLYPRDDPHQSQNLMGSKLDQDASATFCGKIQAVVFG